MSVKILHCADLHIGAQESFLGERAQSRRLETLLTFERIVELASTNEVEVILIAGDLLDSNKIEQSFIDRILAAISSVANIKVVYACGNHDPLGRDFPFKKLRLPENLYILPTEDNFVEFEDLKVRVYGKSFSEVYLKGVSEFSIKPEIDYINLMCIHGDLRADLGSDYNSITDSFIRNSGMDYIALGHVHKRTDIGKIGNTFCAYCGCSEGQGFDELGEKGVYMGTVSKGKADLEFKSVCRRMHITEAVKIESIPSSPEIADAILSLLSKKYGENFSENLYKITLTGATDKNSEINIAEILERLENKVYFAKIKDKTEPQINLSEIASENSLKGIFVKKMLEKINLDDENKQRYIYALKIGLKAFNTEGELYEDK